MSDYQAGLLSNSTLVEERECIPVSVPFVRWNLLLSSKVFNSIQIRGYGRSILLSRKTPERSRKHALR